MRRFQMEMDQSSSQEDENSACETKKRGERCLQDNVVGSGGIIPNRPNQSITDIITSLCH